ncbi:MAG: zinc finger Ran-binding domain-containing protein [Candidatus Limnocylindrales bacterium]
MNDIWVCSACKSINRQRDAKCYKCGARETEAMADTGPGLRVETAVANRQVRGYAPAWPFAVIASVLIIAVVALGLYLVLEQASTIGAVKTAFAAALTGGDNASLDALLQAENERLADPALARTLLLFLAVVAFGVWLARVMMNIPALGGGKPNTVPWKALVYPMIPVLNLIKVPGMIQEALYRVDPRAGGFFMVVIAWFGLAGSVLVTFFGEWIITATGIARIMDVATVDEAIPIFYAIVDQTYALAIVTEVMIAGGAVILVLIMGRVEARSAARDREIRAAVLG